VVIVTVSSREQQVTGALVAPVGVVFVDQLDSGIGWSTRPASVASGGIGGNPRGEFCG
jgi:hypothetical protein